LLCPPYSAPDRECIKGYREEEKTKGKGGRGSSRGLTGGEEGEQGRAEGEGKERRNVPHGHF